MLLRACFVGFQMYQCLFHSCVLDFEVAVHSCFMTCQVYQLSGCFECISVVSYFVAGGSTASALFQTLHVVVRLVQRCLILCTWSFECINECSHLFRGSRVHQCCCQALFVVREMPPCVYYSFSSLSIVSSPFAYFLGVCFECINGCSHICRGCSSASAFVHTLFVMLLVFQRVFILCSYFVESITVCSWCFIACVNMLPYVFGK